jgi:HD domain
MTDVDYKELADFFDDYALGFITRAANAHPHQTKKAHTARVVENMVFLGTSLGLSPQRMRVAKTAALLHDIGRFRQFESYGTFSDVVSKNHGALGVGVIREHRLLASWPISEKKQILRSIALHNAYHLPPGMDTDTLFLTRLLRDADKLDIFHVVTQNYLGADLSENGYLTHNLVDDGLISKDLVARILKKELIDNRQVRSVNDLKLLQISWVFDLNFNPAVRQVKNLGFIPLILSTLPDSDLLAFLGDFMEDYLAKKAELMAKTDPSIIHFPGRMQIGL